MLKYVVCLCRGCDGCCVFCLYCEPLMLVYGECKCFVMQMLYVCVHPVAVLNAVVCMNGSLLMLVEDAIDDHTEEAYSRAGLPILLQ